MNIDLQLRAMAQLFYWQRLYKASKENGIQLFDNSSNLSGLQIRFLYWLEVYDTLYSELARFENKFLTKNVIASSFRCDCYLTYRKKLNEFEWKKYRQEEKKRKIQENHPKRHKKGNMIPIEVDLRSE